MFVDVKRRYNQFCRYYSPDIPQSPPCTIKVCPLICLRKWTQNSSVCLQLVTLMIVPVLHTCTRHTQMHAQRCTHNTHIAYFSHRFTLLEVCSKCTLHMRHIGNYGRCRIITVLPEGSYYESLFMLMTGCHSYCDTGGERPSWITWGCGKYQK